MKRFSKEKFIEAMKVNPEITDEDLQPALDKWVNAADGRTVEELEEECFLIHPNWVIEVDE